MRELSDEAIQIHRAERAGGALGWIHTEAYGVKMNSLGIEVAPRLYVLVLESIDSAGISNQTMSTNLSRGMNTRSA